MSEIWKDIAGFEGRYQVSNLGRVKSLAREVRIVRRDGIEDTRPVPETIMRQCRDKDGYVTVNLSRDGSRFTAKVHHLVLLAFHGPRPDGKESRHLNRIRTDNRASNLLWGTHQENIEDRRRDGMDQVGEKHHNARLTTEEVIEIKRRYKAGDGQYSLAEEYKVSQATVSDIVNSRRWKHLSIA